MRGSELREIRKRRGWTQQEVARRLGVSQAYVSQIESGRRPLTFALLRRLAKRAGLPPLSLPLGEVERWRHLPDPNDEIARALGHLGYPGFGYYRGNPRYNPAELLIGALLQPDLEVRVTEGLPWLALAYHEMDWNWVIRQAKLHDLQNRLGFVVTLARDLAERKHRKDAAQNLSQVAAPIARSRLSGEDTLCQGSMPMAERRWLRDNRSPEAATWNLLSTLCAEELTHAQ